MKRMMLKPSSYPSWRRSTIDTHHVDVDIDLAILETNVKVIFLMGRLLLHLGYVRTCQVMNCEMSQLAWR